MTEQEASRIRSAYGNGCDYAFGYGGRMDELMKDPEKWAETERHAELLDDAIKKQIPKKPIKDREQVFRYTSSYSCPNCGGGFTGTGAAEYCYHCGQKLDWGDFDKHLFENSKQESEDKKE